MTGARRGKEHMQRRALVELLSRCLSAHSPSGREEEMIELLTIELGKRSLAHELDPAGNVAVSFPGTDRDSPVVLITGHTDEVAMTVKRVGDDGRLGLSPLGGVVPYKYGEGPVEILGDTRTCYGVLSFGSLHATDESGAEHADPLTGSAETAKWKHWCVETKLTREQLRDAGVYPGTRVVQARTRKVPVTIAEHYISGYAIDDKASVPVLIALAERLAQTPPVCTTVLGFTSREETGSFGAAWLAHSLRPQVLIAVETAPMMPEYGLDHDDLPVLCNQDRVGTADVRVVRRLREAARRRGVELQNLVSEVGANDAGLAASAGHAARPATIAAPTYNMHGWELCHIGALEQIVEVLDDYLHSSEVA